MLIDRVKKLRENYNWTHDDLAKKIGITRTSYTKKENGERKFTEIEILKLSEAFDVSTDYLLGKKDSSPNKKTELPSIDQEEISLAALIRWRNRIANGEVTDIPKERIPFVVDALDKEIRIIEENIRKQK